MRKQNTFGTLDSRFIGTMIEKNDVGEMSSNMNLDPIYKNIKLLESWLESNRNEKISFIYPVENLTDSLDHLGNYKRIGIKPKNLKGKNMIYAKYGEIYAVIENKTEYIKQKSLLKSQWLTDAERNFLGKAFYPSTQKYKLEVLEKDLRIALCENRNLKYENSTLKEKLNNDNKEKEIEKLKQEYKLIIEKTSRESLILQTLEDFFYKIANRGSKIKIINNGIFELSEEVIPKYDGKVISEGIRPLKIKF